MKALGRIVNAAAIILLFIISVIGVADEYLVWDKSETYTWNRLVDISAHLGWILILGLAMNICCNCLHNAKNKEGRVGFFAAAVFACPISILVAIYWFVRLFTQAPFVLALESAVIPLTVVSIIACAVSIGCGFSHAIKQKKLKKSCPLQE